MTTDVHALVGAYALDAVDDLERVAFDRHVADCESCRTELDELRETVGRLADSTWSVPPPRLRDNVLTAISQTRQVPARPVRDAPVEVSRWRRYAAGAAAAVVLAAGAGATSWVVQEQRVRQERAVATIAQRDQARSESILAAPDVVFRTAPIVGGGKVTVASSASRNAGVILLAAAAPPADGRVFQLWTIRGGTPQSEGALPPGQASVVQIVDGLPGATEVGVTSELAPESRTPTTPMVSAVQLI